MSIVITITSNGVVHCDAKESTRLEFLGAMGRLRDDWIPGVIDHVTLDIRRSQRSGHNLDKNEPAAAD